MPFFNPIRASFSGGLLLLLLAHTAAVMATPASVPAAPVSGHALGSAAQVAFSPIQSVSFHDLHLEPVIKLPTISAQREIEFYLPQHWVVNGGASHLNLVLQHSSQLQPHRSYLEVIVNNQVLKKVALTSANAAQTNVPVPLTAPLHYGPNQKNTLKLRVVQHYTDQCEDPTDASLWTQVLDDSQLVFHVSPRAIKHNLAQYPAPLVDTKAFKPAQLHYVVPAQLDDASLGALAHTQAFLGMVAHNQPLKTSVSVQDASALTTQSGHLIVIGTPAGNSAIGTMAKAFTGATLNGAQWMVNGSPLPNGSGLIRIFDKPGQPGAAVLLITANDSQGLLNAAQFLTHKGTANLRQGAEVVVDGGWRGRAQGVKALPAPRYLANESRTLAQLGFGDQYVEKIYAPPITLPLPVVTDFQRGGAQLTLNVTYSYGSGLNPRYSSLEWILNNRSIGSVPLTNPNGQERATATLPIPTHLLGVHNTLVAQFHMLPDKYGFCVDNYEDNAWGKIFADATTLQVTGVPASRLPSIGLLNSTGFPYTQTMDLSNAHWVLPANATPSQIQAFLALAGRLGRVSDSEGGLNLTVSTKVDPLPGGRHALVVGSPAQVQAANGSGLPIHVNSTGAWTLNLWRWGEAIVHQWGLGTPLLQQGTLGGRTVAWLNGNDDAAFTHLSQLLEDDQAFSGLDDGAALQAIALSSDARQPFAFQTVLAPMEGSNKPSATQPSSGGGLGWLDWLLKPLGNLFNWIFSWPIWAPFKWVGGLLTQLIQGFLSLPLINVIVPAIFGFLSPVLNWGPLGALTGWLAGHPILNFLAGSALLATLWGWVMALVRRLMNLVDGE
ncbi:MAG: cellulose biosynthesis cyclic di-GMP-binding regulatory protein BcsB [Vampirovibrionales bacterium]